MRLTGHLLDAAIRADLDNAGMFFGGMGMMFPGLQPGPIVEEVLYVPFEWKFDNYVHATSPYMFNNRDAREIWGRITCPTLLIRGTESWAGDWVKDGRIQVFKNAESVTVDKAGHWVHHDRLDEFLAITHRFLGL